MVVGCRNRPEWMELSMSEHRADVALLIDFTDLCQSLNPSALGAAEPAPAADAGENAESPASPILAPEHAVRIAEALQEFSGQVGRVAIARAYADWSRCAVLAREVNGARLEPVLVPATLDGEDRSHIRLVTDALEALYNGDEPDAFVLVTGDPTLLPLVQKLKATGSEVIIVAPDGTIAEELRDAADRYVSLEQVLAGAETEPARPRVWRGRGLNGAEGRARGSRVVTEARRERPAHPTPIRSEADFDTYAWEPFIRLIDELEHRLPFVGVRYLVNKVLGMHNCGVDDPRLKRDLINRAVDEGLIEMYPVGNVGERADPVTACRLDRGSATVVGLIGETEVPEAPTEQAGDLTEAIERATESI